MAQLSETEELFEGIAGCFWLVLLFVLGIIALAAIARLSDVEIGL